MADNKTHKQKNVILGVGAHPDDMDFGASGTMAKYIEDGWEGYYIVATDGSRGSNDPKMTHERLAQTRTDEQMKAAKILGLKDVFFLGHTDTQLVADLILKEQIVRIIRTIKPKIVITMDPTFYYAENSPLSDAAWVNHTDHRNIALATMDAVFPLSRDRLTFLEHERDKLSPHRVEELWLTAFDHTKFLVNITSTFDKKIKALIEHQSQFDDFPKVEKRVTERARHHAREMEYEFAESFIRLVMP